MDELIGLLVVGFVLGIMAVSIAWILERFGITVGKKTEKNNGGEEGNKPKDRQDELAARDKKMNNPYIDNLLGLLETIHQTCIDKAPTELTYDSENMQIPYMLSMYSIAVELTGDSYQAVKSRKELASHVLTRALLEAVVILRNVVNDPDQVNNRFQKALAKGIMPLKYQLDNPDLIDTAKHSVKDIKKLRDKHEELRDPKFSNSLIEHDFDTAGMENYYRTRYAYLCNYSHHDASAIINRNIGINVCPLDEKGTHRLADWISDLILKASIGVHEFLGSDQSNIFQDLQQKWKTMLHEKQQ